VTQAYNQGLQTGQALRNILLDPSKPRPTTTFCKPGKRSPKPSRASPPSPRRSMADAARPWAPLQGGVIELVRAGDVSGARALPVQQETPVWRDIHGELLKQISHLEMVAAQTRAEPTATLQRGQLIVAELGAAALAVCVIAPVVVMRSVLGQLGGEPAYAVARRVAEGGLRQPVVIAAKDDGSLLAAMRTMQISLQDIRSIRADADRLVNAADVLRGNERKVADASHAQSAERARAAVSELEGGVTRMREAVTAISLALAEQRQASTGIAQNVERIARMSDDTRNATGDSLQHAEELSPLGGTLESAVGRFRIDA
jgi:methyl-accepting chemotaxis protein